MSGRILIVDGVATHRIVLKVKLATACYTVLQADSGAAALATMRAAPPELVVLDLGLPDTDALALCRRIKSDPATAEVPVIAIAGAADPATRLRALQAGAEELLVRPLDEVRLLARVRSLLRVRETEAEFSAASEGRRGPGFAEPAEGFAPPGRIALVGHETVRMMRRKSGLAERLSDHVELLAPETALAGADHATAPELFVVAVEREDSRAALRLLSDLRSRAATRTAAVVLLVPERAGDTAAMALDLGADDVLADTAPPEEMAICLARQLRRKRRRDRRRSSLRDDLRLAQTDPLTGLFNRRYAMPSLGRMAAQARATGHDFAVMLLDLDRFKAVNDRHGHAAGDAVLVEVAARLRAHLGEGDLVARIGGEEFLVALPDTGREQGEGAARALCKAINARPVPIPGQEALHATVSIGLAIGDGGAGPDMLLERADRALYEAKAEGRNKVTVGHSAA